MNTFKLKFWLPFVVNLFFLIPVLKYFLYNLKPNNSYSDDDLGILVSFFVLPLFLFIFNFYLIKKFSQKLNQFQTVLAYICLIFTNPAIVWFGYLIVTSFTKASIDERFILFFLITESIITNILYFVLIKPKK
jgi:hypothetical protein